MRLTIGYIHLTQSVSRLITNNPIALTLYIPRWNGEAEKPDSKPSVEYWHLDNTLSDLPSLAHRWTSICDKFSKTQNIIAELASRYVLQPVSSNPDAPKLNFTVMHAMVLAHIVAKRTDDPKVGVGAVLVDRIGRYVSVGWNGYPKRSATTDYPQYGADDTLDDETLKYDYILHAEHNALLWRSPGLPLDGTVMVTTKMPWYMLVTQR
jgi:Cytidine and deoxycytidylate deaminase zinc-binding region